MFSRKTTVSALALLVASAGAAAAFPATVTNDLNVRSGPGTGYGVVDQLQAGETVDVLATQGSWYQLSDGGWASGNYLDAEGSAAVESGYEVAEYPSYYGSPAFYYGADPYFWDDSGYYFSWRNGRRHNVDWNWFRNHRDHDFKWTDARHRNDFDGRRGRYDGDRSANRNRGDDGNRSANRNRGDDNRGDNNRSVERNRGDGDLNRNAIRRSDENDLRTGRASTNEGIDRDGGNSRGRGGEMRRGGNGGGGDGGGMSGGQRYWPQAGGNGGGGGGRGGRGGNNN